MSYRISGSLLHRHRGYCRIESEGSCSIESEKGVFNLVHKDACVGTAAQTAEQWY